MRSRDRESFQEKRCVSHECAEIQEICVDKTQAGVAIRIRALMNRVEMASFRSHVKWNVGDFSIEHLFCDVIENTPIVIDALVIDALVIEAASICAPQRDAVAPDVRIRVQPNDTFPILGAKVIHEHVNGCR